MQDTPDPEWDTVELTSDKLCNGDWDRQLKVEIFDYDGDGSHDFIGEFYTTLNEVSASL